MKAKYELILGMLESAELAFQIKMKDIKTVIEKAEQEEAESEKTYPIGFDPDGEWCIIWNCSDKWEVITITGHAINNWHKTGQQFTTQEQAQKAAAGKNAMRELVMAIHEISKRLPDDTHFHYFRCMEKGVLVTSKTDTKTNLSFPGGISAHKALVEKLGEKKIKLAMEHGI